MLATRPTSRTLPDLLREQAGKYPDGLAAITPQGQISYADLLKRAAGLASALRRHGIGRGMRVGLVMGNGISWLEMMFGVTMTGAVLVPFSTWSTRSELEFLIEDSAIDLLFSVPEFSGRNFEVDLADFRDGAQFKSVRNYVLVSENSAHGLLTYDQFLTSKGDLGSPPAEWPSAADDAVVLYTSGSTSRPKGVRLKHYGIVENGYSIGERQGLRPGDRVFLSAPLFWSFGGANALPATLSNGATLVLPTKFSAESALEMVERHACTAIYTLPAMTTALLNDAAFSKHRMRTVRTGVTIGTPEDFIRAAEELGVPELCNIYGATETYGNCAVTWHHWPLSRRAGSQGTPLPHQQFRFRDPETGQVLPDGAEGLVEVRGYVSPGYTGASEALNGEAFTEDGFYRTGDIGKLGSNGEFIFIGRNSEMIKRAGINVSPAEVEDVLLQYEGLGQVAVIGTADRQRDQRIVAFVVPAAGHDLIPSQILDHCRELLSKYKLPDHIEVVSSLPTTVTGKLHRKALEADAAGLLAAVTNAGDS